MKMTNFFKMALMGIFAVGALAAAATVTTTAAVRLPNPNLSELRLLS